MSETVSAPVANSSSATARLLDKRRSAPGGAKPGLPLSSAKGCFSGVILRIDLTQIVPAIWAGPLKNEGDSVDYG
jgi:hypothetical protein